MTTALPHPESIDLSLVIPVYNEEDNLRPLAEEIRAALGSTGLDYEALFIDDGSKDGSFACLQELAAEDDHIVAIRFRRNYGQTAAFAAGFDHARGRVIVTLDADRQNDPADIPRLLAELDKGYDVVNGWRENRQDNLVRRFPSRVANWLIAETSGVRLRDRGCSLRAFRAEVVRDLHLYGELHRFIPELVSFGGFSMSEVPVNHRARVAGASKYGLSRTFRVILDLFTIHFLRKYGDRPMQLFGRWGIILFALGALVGGYLTGLKLWAGITGGMAGFNAMTIGDRPLLLLAVLLVILGVQFIVMGLIAELTVRTYYETQDLRVYRVRQIIGRDSLE
ncbi:Glycosyl transferase family 2 [Candidatus Promineifilum breve]|uniref:Glycosyl transferase family 2 n=1 Tax=Candidatus Promineifilum breve TaxID=1806508 RepID=A0A161K3K0_9CHLR|nr:glycosyltransferase family 2 protein [Candidatus Promineifilum breve]CUS04897.2 Glycosyl transferase family 2 [Candidatus Promineifilum breve]